MFKPSPKEFALGFLTVGVSTAMFWFWKSVVPLVIENKFNNPRQFIIAFLTLVLAAVFFALGALFIKNRILSYAVVILAVLPPYFFLPPSTVVFVGAAITALLEFWALHRIRKDFFLSISFGLSNILKRGLHLYFTAVAVVLSFFYFNLVKGEDAISLLLPKPTFVFLINSLSGPLGPLTGLTTLDSQKTTNEVLTAVVTEELQSRGIPLSRIPKAEINKLIMEQRQAFSKQFNVELRGEEKIIDAFYRIVTQMIEASLGPYRSYFPFALAAVFFFAFKTISWPLYYVAMLITSLLIKIMIAVKILKQEKMQVEVERITL